VQDLRVTYLVNSSKLESSDNQNVGSGELREMSEYPVPHGEHYHSCILRRWRPAFLHPKGDTESDRSATGLMRKCSQDCFPSPNKGANQTSSPEKACESMVNEKNPPNSELEHP
jgi:hypothetical protein